MTERNTRVRANQIRSIFPNDIEGTNSPSDNQVPSYDLATGKFTWVTTAGGVSNLDDLGDVDFDSGTPADNYVLIYDNASGKWKAEALNHNDMAGIQGGISNEYYHLTSSEYTELSNWLDNVTLGNDGKLTLPSGTDINEFSIDGTLAGDSDNAVPTEKAVKTYIDAIKDAKFLIGDTSTDADLDNEILTKNINPQNLLQNGGFEHHWCQGDGNHYGAYPWEVATLSTGTITRESTIVKNSNTFASIYSAKMVSVASNAFSYFQNIHIYDIFGKDVTFSCWVYASDASRVRIRLRHSSTTTFSSYHTGSGDWELLTVTATMGVYNTAQAGINIDSGTAITVYVDNATLVKGTIPFNFVSSPEDILFNTRTGIQNLGFNGGFEYWYSGTSSAPDAWTLNTGSIARESTEIRTGAYSAKLTSSVGANGLITQYIHNTGYKPIGYYQGRVLTASCWVKCSTADKARIALHCQAQASYSSYHTGSGDWELLVATIDVPASGTYVRLYCQVALGATTDAYFDDFMVVEGHTPFAYAPHPEDHLYKQTEISIPYYSVIVGDSDDNFNGIVNNSGGYAYCKNVNQYMLFAIPIPIELHGHPIIIDECTLYYNTIASGDFITLATIATLDGDGTNTTIITHPTNMGQGTTGNESHQIVDASTEVTAGASGIFIYIQCAGADLNTDQRIYGLNFKYHVKVHG